jgi:hypothetical protein
MTTLMGMQRDARRIGTTTPKENPVSRRAWAWARRRRKTWRARLADAALAKALRAIRRAINRRQQAARRARQSVLARMAECPEC